MQQTELHTLRICSVCGIGLCANGAEFCLGCEDLRQEMLARHRVNLSFVFDRLPRETGLMPEDETPRVPVINWRCAAALCFLVPVLIVLVVLW